MRLLVYNLWSPFVAGVNESRCSPHTDGICRALSNRYFSSPLTRVKRRVEFPERGRVDWRMVQVLEIVIHAPRAVTFKSLGTPPIEYVP